MFRAGLDWGKETHALCVVDQDGKKVLEMQVPHSARGWAEAFRKLAALARPEEIPVAIERPDGIVVDRLVDAGYPVVPIHPNVLKASRPRYSAACGKSDPGDAYMLADLLRTDGHRFRALEPHSDAIRALRAVVRARDELVIERVALANRLRALLESFWPGATSVFSSIDSLISLAFLKKYPTPSQARRLDAKQMGKFLRQQGYPGRRTPEQLLERLRRAPVGSTGPVEEEVKGELVLTLVHLLRGLVDRLRMLKSRIEQMVQDIPDGRIFMSLPRAGKLNAAQILAELGGDPARFSTEAHLAAEAGVVPVTMTSGKRRGVFFRHACNKRLRKALTCFANNSRFESAWARSIYARARARGCEHSHAVRVLARAWVRVLWRAWHDGIPYDVKNHGAAARMQKETTAQAAA